MINKRLLVKNLLAYTNENSFYDKKQFLNLGDREGKAKFLKHVCALANSNPKNNSYLVIGVTDEDAVIEGVDFFDDSKIQNLVNAYLENPPAIAYENIPFPHLPQGKVVGLVTIASSGKVCFLKKNIWKYTSQSAFFREGSTSILKTSATPLQDVNAATVAEIEHYSVNNIEHTLHGVIDFLHNGRKDLETHYKVFKEQFVLCWAGLPKKVKDKTYFSRVDIELINEQVKLFYSTLDEVEIHYTEDSFTTIEYVHLGLHNQQKYYPLETVSIDFKDNGTYQINSCIIFQPPQYDKKMLYHVYNANNNLLDKLVKKLPLTTAETNDLKDLPATYLICALNGFEDSKEKLETHRSLLKQYDMRIYASVKEVLRIMRKIKYN